MVVLLNTAHAFPFPWPCQAFAALNKYRGGNPIAPHVVSIDVIDRTVLDDGSVRSERLIGVQQDSPKWINRLLGSQDVTFVREVSFVVPSGCPSPAMTTTIATTSIEPPKLLLASTNLTLSNLLQCRETISYLPHPWPYTPPALAPVLPSVNPSEAESERDHVPERPKPHPLAHASMPPHTLFSQSALIFSTGMFASEKWPPKGITHDSPVEALSRSPARTMPQRAAGRKAESWSAGRFDNNAAKGREAMMWAAKNVWDGEWSDQL